MARTRYLTMTESSVTNSQGVAYPDILSFPIDKFKYTEEPYEYVLTQSDIDRFDYLMYRFYNTAYYDDMVLWLNNIASLHDLEPGDTINLPSKTDLENFFIKYSR